MCFLKQSPGRPNPGLSLAGVAVWDGHTRSHTLHGAGARSLGAFMVLALCVLGSRPGHHGHPALASAPASDPGTTPPAPLDIISVENKRGPRSSPRARDAIQLPPPHGREGSRALPLPS